MFTTTVPPDSTEVPAVFYSVTSEVPAVMDSETSVPLEITASGTAEPRAMTGSNVAFPVWAAIAVVAILAAVFLRARKKRQSK